MLIDAYMQDIPRSYRAGRLIYHTTQRFDGILSGFQGLNGVPVDGERKRNQTQGNTFIPSYQEEFCASAPSPRCTLPCAVPCHALKPPIPFTSVSFLEEASGGEAEVGVGLRARKSAEGGISSCYQEHGQANGDGQPRTLSLLESHPAPKSYSEEASMW